MVKLVATKSNWLVEASYKLTLQEQRFLLVCIGKLNPFQDCQSKTMTLTATEFFESFEEMGRENAERELKKAIDRLWDRSVIVKDPEQTEEFRWIQNKAKYHKGEARVSVTFSDSVMPYLTQLKGQFTSVVVKNVSCLSSAYSIRVYELLFRYAKAPKKERYFPLDEFRTLLGIGDKYPQFRDLNRRVITPAVEELNAKSDLNVRFEAVKQGRGGKVAGIKFYFSIDKQIRMAV